MEIIRALERGEIRCSPVLLGQLAIALGCRVAEFYGSERDVPDDRPSDMGAAMDAWVQNALVRMPDPDDDAAMRISAALYPE